MENLAEILNINPTVKKGLLRRTDLKKISFYGFLFLPS
jgi:hypothetical protein